MKRTVSKTEILLRCLIGCAGGYGYAVLLGIFISTVAGGPRAEAVITGVLFSFAAHSVIVLLAFAVRSLWQLCAGLTLSALVMALIIWLELPNV